RGELEAGGTTPGARQRRCRGGTPLSGVSLRPSGRTPPGSRKNCQTSSDHLLSLVKKRISNCPDNAQGRQAAPRPSQPSARLERKPLMRRRRRDCCEAGSRLPPSRRGVPILRRKAGARSVIQVRSGPMAGGGGAPPPPRGRGVGPRGRAAPPT